MQIHLTTASKSLAPIIAACAIAGLAWRQGRRRTAISSAQSAERSVSALSSWAAATYQFGQPEDFPVLQQAAGVIGAGADAYLRAVLVHLLTRATDTARVVTTGNDLDRLFEGQFDLALQSSYSKQLYVADLLEDAVEHLETKAEHQNALLIAANSPECMNTLTTYWFAAPGADTDVVHQTIQRWTGLGLIPLLFGPWPYGPTHQLNDNHRVLGPGCSGSFQTLSVAEAITALSHPATA